MKSAIFKYQGRHKIILVLLIAAVVFIAGCAEKSSQDVSPSPKQALGTGNAMKLSDAYSIAKPSAVSKIGRDADMFNAVTFTLKEDGTANAWIVSFCSPSQMKSVAVVVEDGVVKAVSDVVQLDANKNEFCEPLQPNRKDSSDVMAVLPDAKTCITSAGQGSFLIYYNPKADNEEGWVWKVICGQKYWDVDVYSGKLIASGEGVPTISLPSIR